jgi:hypothetical protein
MPMKKLLCLCLMLSLLVACSSEKDAKPNPAAAPELETAAVPTASEPITSLLGEYILSQTESKKTKVGSEEVTCNTTHTYTLMFINDNTVQYTAKTDLSMDPPMENMMCASKIFNVDVSGTYEIKDGLFVKLIFSPSDGKMPWVHKDVMSLKLNNINSLEIMHNGAKFQKQ